MKKLLLLLLLAFVGNTSAFTGMTLEKCAGASEMAGEIMDSRQKGVSMAETYLKNARTGDKENVEMLNDIARIAYTEWSMAKSARKYETIRAFKDRVFIKCFDSIQQ